MRAFVDRLRERLRRPTDAASLVAFRVLFGAVMATAMLRLLANGWVEPLFTEPRFHFTYPGFGWVRPWPGAGMTIDVAVVAAAAIGVALGRLYRASALVLFLGITYLELVDKALYLNHYYLASLLAGLLVVLPAPRAGQPLPAWVLFALRTQVGLVYFFAGVAKLDADWLLRAQPLRTWLAARADLPLVGPWLEEPAIAFAASWAAAAFDLAIVPLLLWRRTRTAAFVALVGFHIATRALFSVGMFPLVMTAAATLFLAPDWSRRRRLLGAGAPAGQPLAPAGERALLALVGVHLAVQALLPLRQHVLPGPSAWTGQGFNFAWNVMVAEKSGAVVFTAVDRATGRATTIRPSAYLTPQQESAMAQDPELIAALARHVAADHEARGGGAVSVFADARAALNGRPAQPLLDPTRDLATEPPRVLPLTR